MSDKINGIYTTAAPMELDHHSLAEPRKFKDRRGKETGEAKYEAAFFSDPTHPDWLGIKAKMAEVAKAKWPGRDFNDPPQGSPGAFKWPVASGERIIARHVAELKKENKPADTKYDYLAGKVRLTARSKYEVKLSGIESGRLTDYEGPNRAANMKHFYRGVGCLFQVNFAAYAGVGENPDGVNAYINMVMTTKKGDKRGGQAASAADTFKGYVGHDTAEDPTEGKTLDDGLGF